MRIRSCIILISVAIWSPAANSSAQMSPEKLRDDLLQHFILSSSKVLQLSEAVPAGLYEWAPSEGVMTVAHVFAHIARYNYMYLEENLGIAAPEEIDYHKIEDIRDKERLVGILQESVRHAQEAIRAMRVEDLMAETVLYGRDVEGWSVLVQLVSHLNEHTGQSVAYARMNGIVPPWSM